MEKSSEKLFGLTMIKKQKNWWTFLNELKRLFFFRNAYFRYSTTINELIKKKIKKSEKIVEKR